MKAGKIIWLWGCMCCLAAGKLSGQGAEIVHSLADADREFAWTLQEEGIRKAYLDYLDRESLVYTPTAVRGPEHYRGVADSGMLFRSPEWVEVSDDGLLGYTSGPFEYRADPLAENPDISGHYLSIWRRKNARSDWAIILDVSVEHEGNAAPRSIRYNQPVSGKVPITPALELAKSKQILIDSDELFNVSLRAGRLEFGYTEFFTDSVQLYREAYPPFRGRKAAMAHLLQMKGKYIYTTQDAYMSHVRDIAYTFGTGHYYEHIRTSRFDQHFSYVRIWRKDSKGLWKVILDLEKPYEPAAPTLQTEQTE